MEKNPAALEAKLAQVTRRDASALLHEQKMAGERLASYVRLGYALFGSLSILSAAPAQSRTSTLVELALASGLVAWSVVILFLLRDGITYRPAVKIYSAVVDTTLLHGWLLASFAFSPHHADIFRYPSLWLWIAVSNGLTGLRYSWKTSVLGGCLTLLYGSAVIGYAHSIVHLPWVAEGRYFGQGLLLKECVLSVLACALPAFFAAIHAARSQQLLNRAVLEAALRSGMGQDLHEAQQALKAKVKELETRNEEVQLLNEELRRQMEQRSRLVLDTLLPNTGNPFAALGRLATGALLGNYYRLIRPIGEGGMGVVYEVERTTDHRRFAAKALTKQPDRTAIDRFAREAQILARLNHPNLISIFDVDVTSEGGLYIVMELVDGTSLWQLRAQFGTANPSWGIAIVRQIADALAVLHGQGIVHRDLKPENVLVARNPSGKIPTVKLADFGISVLLGERGTQAPSQRSAKAAAPGPSKSPLTANVETMDGRGAEALVTTEPEAVAPVFAARAPVLVPVSTPRPASGPVGRELTGSGAIVGTPLYMAPELVSGSRNAQPSADMFSFGVIAFEVLTGLMPFERPAIVATALGEELKIPSLRDRRPDLHAALASTLEQCLSVDPKARPQALDVGNLLAQWQETGSQSEERRLPIKPVTV